MRAWKDFDTGHLVVERERDDVRVEFDRDCSEALMGVFHREPELLFDHAAELLDQFEERTGHTAGPGSRFLHHESHWLGD